MRHSGPRELFKLVVFVIAGRPAGVVLFVCSLGLWRVRVPSGGSPMAALAMRLAAGKLGNGRGNARATSQRSQQHCAHMSANFRCSHFATRIDEP